MKCRFYWDLFKVTGPLLLLCNGGSIMLLLEHAVVSGSHPTLITN